MGLSSNQTQTDRPECVSLTNTYASFWWNMSLPTWSTWISCGWAHQLPIYSLHVWGDLYWILGVSIGNLLELTLCRHKAMFWKLEVTSLVHVQLLKDVAVDLSELSGFLEIISTRSCMCRIFSEWYVVTSFPWEFHLCIQVPDGIVPEREEVWELLLSSLVFPIKNSIVSRRKIFN